MLARIASMRGRSYSEQLARFKLWSHRQNTILRLYFLINHNHTLIFKKNEANKNGF